jgi:hypothetical protein
MEVRAKRRVQRTQKFLGLLNVGGVGSVVD